MQMFGSRGAQARRVVGLLVIGAASVAASEASAQASSAAAKPAAAKRATAAKPAAKQTAKKAAKPAVAAAPIRFVIGSTGNEARYRVRERLMNRELDNDAIGKTSELTGTILAYPDGRIVRDSSRITVNIKNLKSDSDRRDGYLQRRTLESEKFPTVELVPTEVRGFPAAFPTSGPVSFELLGDLTVRGVTRPTVWKVTARAEGQDVAGTATTAFTFKDAGIDQPKVPVVLSVSDTIKLEYDFRFVREAAKQ